eukprot:14564359-Ditylum_brightwellii.AAC.1
MPSYLANSKELKEDFIKLNLPSEQAITSLGAYLMQKQETFKHLPITTICDALKIIMSSHSEKATG